MRSRRAVAITVVMIGAAHGCMRAAVPDVAGRWSGEMMLELGQGRSAFEKVEVNLDQAGERLSGRWRTTDAAEFAADGELTGRIARDGAQHRVEINFSITSRHRIGAEPCTGTARATGSFTYNTAVNSAVNQDRTPHEEAGWGIRLKAHEGLSFQSCPPLRYATWTLARTATTSAVPRAR